MGHAGQVCLTSDKTFVSCMLKRIPNLRCKGLALQVKLLLQPLRGQDPANSRPLCLLDVLSGLKPIREGVIHTILSALVDISCPEAIAVPEPEGAQSMAKQLEASEPGIEALKPPMAEPRAGKSTTEGLLQRFLHPSAHPCGHHALVACHCMCHASALTCHPCMQCLSATCAAQGALGRSQQQPYSGQTVRVDLSICKLLILAEAFTDDSCMQAARSRACSARAA